MLVGGLATFTPVTVGIDETSLSDPMLVPKKALQVVVPRPGVPASVEIGLVGGGDVEGAIVNSGGLGFEGLDLELVDASGKVAATARTDFDGIFLFEHVPHGEYRIRLSRGTAEATGFAPELAVKVSVSAARSSPPGRDPHRPAAPNRIAGIAFTSKVVSGDFTPCPTPIGCSSERHPLAPLKPRPLVACPARNGERC